MKKQYLKPDVEYVNFISTESITDEPVNGEQGADGSVLPDWE